MPGEHKSQKKTYFAIFWKIPGKKILQPYYLDPDHYSKLSFCIRHKILLNMQYNNIVVNCMFSKLWSTLTSIDLWKCQSYGHIHIQKYLENWINYLLIFVPTLYDKFKRSYLPKNDFWAFDHYWPRSWVMVTQNLIG